MILKRKIAILTIHDVNPSCSAKFKKVTEALNSLKIKYNLSVVPNYDKKYSLKNYPDFCKQISTLLQSTPVELTLHGLYHQYGGTIEDYDSESKEEEVKDIKEGLDILKTSGLPRPATFIPPAWYLGRQAIGALVDQNFEIAESRSSLEFVKNSKKYLCSPVMNWDTSGNKEKNRVTLKQNNIEIYQHLFNNGVESYGLFRMAIHPPYDPDEALSDQIEMIRYLKEKQHFTFVNYLDLLKMDEQ